MWQQGEYSYKHSVFHVTAERVQLQTQRISCDSRASTATNTAYFMWQQGEYNYKHSVFHVTAERVQLRKLRISCDSVGGMWIGASKGSWLWTDGTAAFAAGDYTNWKSGKAEWSVWSWWKMRIAGPCCNDTATDLVMVNGNTMIDDRPSQGEGDTVKKKLSKLIE